MKQRKPYESWLMNQMLCFSRDKRILIHECLRSFAKGSVACCSGCKQGVAIKDRYVELRREHKKLNPMPRSGSSYVPRKIPSIRERWISKGITPLTRCGAKHGSEAMA